MRKLYGRTIKGKKPREFVPYLEHDRLIDFFDPIQLKEAIEAYEKRA